MVTVKIVRTNRLDLEGAKALPYLLPSDIAAADRYTQGKDKIAHLVSAYLKRKYVGDWRVAHGGKPIGAVSFNVSHCSGWVAIALCDAAVGIDCEKIRRIDDRLRAYVATAEERSQMTTDEDFFAVWTAKESLVKADGAGFDRKPDGVPSLPLNGAKVYRGRPYYSRQTTIGDLVLSVTRQGNEAFDWTIEEEWE